MNKKIDVMPREKQADNRIIEAGNELFKKWSENKASSYMIVNSVRRAVLSLNNSSSEKAFIEAVAHLFALEMRIKERYKTLLRCIVLYFPWRRETQALALLVRALEIPDGVDIRSEIYVELQKLRERIAAEKAEGSDDDVRGGKRNGKNTDENADGKENELNEESKETGKEESDIENSENLENLEQAEQQKDTAEEKSSEPVEENQATETEIQEEQTTAEEPQEQIETEAQNEKERVEIEEHNDPETETNGLKEKAKPITDRINDIRNFNDIADFSFLNEPTESTKHEEAKKTSFLEELAMEEMLSKMRNSREENAASKNDSDIQRNDKSDEKPFSRNDDEKDNRNDSLTREDMENGKNDSSPKSPDKLNQKNAENLTQKSEETAQTNPNQPQQNVQNTENTNPTNENAESSRTPIQIDMTLDMENEMRRNISANMPEEAIHEHIKLQKSAMREQLDIAFAEFESGKTTEVSKKVEDVKPSQPTVSRGTK